MTHMMIDTETLGLEIDAPIVQLGYALFDLPGNSCRSNVFHTYPGRRIEMTFDTLLWWLDQDDDARRTLTKVSDRISLEDSLIRLSDVHRVENVECVWSHGATFDIPMLEFWCRRFGIKIPWHYRSTRDTRTILWLAGMSHEDIKATVKHSAEADAVAQAIAVQIAYGRIGRMP